MIEERERLPRNPNGKSPFYQPVAEDLRKSPEHIEHLNAVGFQKGHPRVGGRQPIPEEIKGRIGDMIPDALERLHELMFSEKDAVALAAVDKVLSPFVAKAARKIEISHEHTVGDLLRTVNDRLAGHIIEGVIEHDSDDEDDDI